MKINENLKGKTDTLKEKSFLKIYGLPALGIIAFFGIAFLIIFALPIPKDPPPHFQLTATHIDSIAAKMYGDIVTAIGDGAIEQNTQSVVEMIIKSNHTLVVANPTKTLYALTLPRLATSTKITGSTSTDGKRWCFQIVDSDTDYGYYGVVYTEKGLAFQSYDDKLPADEVCYKGITASQPITETYDSGSSGTGYVSYGTY